MPILLPNDMFSAVAESITVMVSEMGTRKIVWMSRPLEEMFGCRYHGELIGEVTDVLFPEAIRERYVAFRQAWEADPRATTGRSIEGLRRDGSTFPVEVSWRAVYAAGTRLVVTEFISLENKDDQPVIAGLAAGKAKAK